MTYDSPGARLLRQYAADHPEHVVWSADRGWHDQDGGEQCFAAAYKAHRYYDDDYRRHLCCPECGYSEEWTMTDQITTPHPKGEGCQHFGNKESEAK